MFSRRQLDTKIVSLARRAAALKLAGRALTTTRPHVAANAATRPRIVVVGSFLFKKPLDDPNAAPLVALVRRSSLNKIYTHKYGPISGKIEPTDEDPLYAALREINEETGLTAGHLSLLAQGEPYSFVDEDVNKEFELYPFAFALRSEVAERNIQLCPENDSWRWFVPAEVSEDLTVPKVLESLRRVSGQWKPWPSLPTRKIIA